MQEVRAHLVGGLAGGTGEGIVESALAAVRHHLQMEVAYLSEFVGGRSVFRAVDAPGFEALAHVGGSMSLQDVYCQHILDGRLPELIADTAREPFALAMPITKALPIGSHVSIPIRHPDGSAYGMFCCLSRRPNPSLNERDLAIMRIFAELVQREVTGALAERAAREAVEARIEAAIAGGGFTMLFQPIFELGKARPSGFEALCRFAIEPRRTPDLWFAEAASIGRAVELECAAIEAALKALEDLPENTYISVNAGPETVASGALEPIFRARGPERIVLELTEHAAVADYPTLVRALAPLRLMGVQLAIDDAGAGYSGLQHILRLRPDVLKLDMALVRDVHADPARRALAAALAHFARETGAVIIAEGIESEAELGALRALGIQRGQGFLLGRPVDLEAAMRLLDEPKEARRA
jgi:EAL domain-containing protein (putative c-di-GMP-specific phosphodiesterase class I)